MSDTQQFRFSLEQQEDFAFLIRFDNDPKYLSSIRRLRRLRRWNNEMANVHSSPGW